MLRGTTFIISSHLDWTSLVNKGFIIWLLGKFFLWDTSGSPSGQDSSILPAWVTNHCAGFGLLEPQFKYMNYFIYTSHHFTHGRYELNKLTSLLMCGFIAQLVEHRTGIAEVTGSNPVVALIFFRLLSNCLNLKIYCDDHSSLWFGLSCPRTKLNKLTSVFMRLSCYWSWVSS